MDGSLVSHVKEWLPAAVYVGRAAPHSGLTTSPFANLVRIGEGVDLWLRCVADVTLR